MPKRRTYKTDGCAPDPRYPGGAEPAAALGSVAGYTLIELILVIMLIGLVMAVAAPNIMPAISFAGFEGSARHLANYGRSAVAYAGMNRQPITVLVDIDGGSYWATQWVPQEEEALFEDEEPFTEEQPETAGLFYFDAPQEVSQEEAAARAREMADRLDRVLRLATIARARNVQRDGLFTDDPMFSEAPMFTEFTFDDEDEDSIEEIMNPLLERTPLPAGVVIESVSLGATEHNTGIVEIEISSLGLGAPVTFYLRNRKDEYYTVVWDAITGGAHLYQGKETAL